MFARSTLIRMLSLVLVACLALCACAFAAKADEGAGSETCSHNIVKVCEWLTDCTYQPKDEEKHETTGYVVREVYCLECYATLEYEETKTLRTIEEDHWFKDGKCFLCEAENTCPHEHIVPNPDDYIWQSLTYTDNGDGTHTLRGYGYMVTSTYCSVCGERWETESDDGPLEKTEKHYFLQGVCFGCDVQNTCVHAHARSSVEFVQDAAYEPVDAQTHRVTGNTHVLNYCPECGEEWYAETSAEESEEIQAHSFQEGVCYYCQFENPCTHENIEELEQISLIDDMAYTVYDEQYHTVYAYVNHYRVCMDCGEMLKLLYFDVQPELKEEHTFINGCCNCGYVAQTVVLPDSLNVIGEEALLGISARTVVIPDGATSIGARAFASCANLKYVVIPDSVTDIADNAFEGSDVTFICSSGSTAASYAQSNGIPMQ